MKLFAQFWNIIFMWPKSIAKLIECFIIENHYGYWFQSWLLWNLEQIILAFLVKLDIIKNQVKTVQKENLEYYLKKVHFDQL
jgi:hypothetical protein